jgi:hypothetical protein
MVPKSLVNVRRADLPKWFRYPCGEVLLNGKRVGILVGGCSRSIRVSPGTHTLGVRFSGFWFGGAHEVAVSIVAEDGKVFRYRCGATPLRNRWASSVFSFSFALCYLAACVAGWFALPLLRAPAQQILSTLYLTTPFVKDRLFLILDQIVKLTTSAPGGVAAGATVFLVATKKARVAFGKRCVYYLKDE